MSIYSLIVEVAAADTEVDQGFSKVAKLIFPWQFAPTKGETETRTFAKPCPKGREASKRPGFVLEWHLAQ
jgi:hypothetical protein